MNRDAGNASSPSGIHILGALGKVTTEAAGCAAKGGPAGAGKGTMHAASTSTWRNNTKGTLMNNGAKVTVILLGMLLGAFAIDVSHPTSAQNAVGGAAKTKQSTLGGAAKRGPVIGGATTQSSVVGAPKQNSIGAATKQGSIGGTATPGSTGSAATPGSTAGAMKPNPPVAPPNKGGTVVTSNLKCAAGACVAKGTKP
jgi:hypothetical protein